MFHNETYSRKLRGDRTRNKISTDDMKDWLREQTRALTAKELAREAGCGVRAAENVKQGRNNFTSAHLSTLFLNRPDIGARYVEFIGQILPGQAEMAEALTRFANAVVRKG